MDWTLDLDESAAAEPVCWPATAAVDQPAPTEETALPPGNQIAVVFRGGGALGACQAFVYQALHEQGIEPHWILEISIGPIKPSLITGNEPQQRVTRLDFGRTLGELVDFSLVPCCRRRLTVGAAHVRTNQMRYFVDRVCAHIDRQRQLHKLRYLVSELVKLILKSEPNSARMQNLAGYGCLTRMHGAPLLAPWLVKQNRDKDIDLSATHIRRGSDAGLLDSAGTPDHARCDDRVNPLERVIVHQPMSGAMEAMR